MESQFNNLKTVFLKSSTLGQISFAFCRDQSKVLDYVYSEKSQFLGDKTDQSEQAALSKYSTERLTVVGVIYGQNWQQTDLDTFIDKANTYTNRQYLSELFPYLFMKLSTNNGILMLQSEANSNYVSGNLEDKLVSNLNAMLF